MVPVRRPLCTLLTLLCCVLAAPLIGDGAVGVAHAQPKPIDKQKAAKQYVEAGLTAQDAGDYATALTMFGKAYELVPHPVLLFNIAQVHRLAARPAQALDFYRRYVAADPKGAQVKTAQEFITALEVQLANQARTPTPPDPERARLAEEAAKAKADAEAARAEAAAQKAKADAATRARDEAEAARLAEAARAKQEADAAEQARRDEEARQVSDDIITRPPPPPPPPRKQKSRALWLGLAAAAVVTGVIIDVVPESSSNGSLDALDFAPLVLYPLGAGLVVRSF